MKEMYNHFNICFRCPFYKDHFIVFYKIGVILYADMFGNCRFRFSLNSIDNRLQKIILDGKIVIFDVLNKKFKYSSDENWKEAKFELPNFFDDLNCDYKFEHEFIGG